MKQIEAIDLTRRSLLIGGGSLALSALLFGCRTQNTGNRNIGIDGNDYTIQPPQTVATEISLEASVNEVEIASGRKVSAWTYGGQLPGQEIRVKQGERVRINFKNNLPTDSSVHWHGIRQRGTNKMDGVPGVTQEAIQAGGSFVYDFLAEYPGTYFFHPHSGLQIERGLYAPLIVEAKTEKLSYDREYTLVLDDWLDGSPDDVFDKLIGKKGASSMPGMNYLQMQMNMEAGADVNYSTFLINGRTPESPAEFAVKNGEKVRLRVINAAGSTIFRFAVGGHKLTVTHADAFAVKPIEVDNVEIAPGERYDVVITAKNVGAWIIAAMSTDEPTRGGKAILRYAEAQATSTPSAQIIPDEIKGQKLNYRQLIAADDVQTLASGEPNRRLEINLGGQMNPYQWTLNGKTFPAEPFEIRAGERVRVSLVNHSMMRHPMHIHGHSFSLLNGQNQLPLKDTVIVEPMMGKVAFDFLADNPGDWVFHCHHAYHMGAGMMRVIKYV